MTGRELAQELLALNDLDSPIYAVVVSKENGEDTYYKVDDIAGLSISYTFQNRDFTTIQLKPI